MVRHALCLVAVLVVLGSDTARAVVGATDDTPAASLLLPHFEVDLSSATGQNTLFSINNSSASSAVAHVVLWTDFGVPTLTFDVYLTGFDSQVVDLRRVFSGVLPTTGDDGTDPTDTLSPQGPLSQDINFPGSNAPCGPDSAAIPAPLLAELRDAHTGNSTSSFGGPGCVGFDFGDDVARGYVTVDSVTQCTTENPTSAGYFAGIADTRNILWGDVFHVERSRTLTRAENLVHIETSLDDPEVNDAGEYTFYMRHVASAATDRREPLATRFGTRFFDGITRLEVWRDVKVATQAPVACGTNPSWYPLGQEEIVVFNEQEDVFGVGGTPFPLATNRVLIDDLGIPFPTGWIYLNLNTTVAGQAGPTEDAAAAQAWVGAGHEESERFSAGANAVPFDNATAVYHPLVCGGSCP